MVAPFDPRLRAAVIRAHLGGEQIAPPHRTATGTGNINQLVGDYTNPILKPEAAEVAEKHGEIMLSGTGYPDPRNQCQPQGVPYVFSSGGMQLLQQRDKVTFLYDYDHQVRHVRMNQPHPAQVTPSWYGDSVGHYEGDTLVIDTVGFKVGPLAMVDRFGTPHTSALHVVERYRLLDYDAAKEGMERDATKIKSPWGPGTRLSGASTCSSNSRSRMKVSSRCPGRRP